MHFPFAAEHAEDCYTGQVDPDRLYSPRGAKGGDDLIPSFRTKLSMIFAKERGRRYVEEQAHGSADDRCAEASGSWAGGGGCGTRTGGMEADAECHESVPKR